MFTGLRYLRSKLKWLVCTKLWKMSIHPSVRIAPTALLDRTFPQGIIIEEDAVIGEHVAILTHDITRKIMRQTRIGPRTIIEARAIVLPGVTVGADCLIMPGALVGSDMPDGTVARGNPAQFCARDPRKAKPDFPAAATTLSMYSASIPVFLRGLDVLSVSLDRAVAHATARSLDVGILVGARLAPDMLPFAGQIQRASDTAKFAAGRLADLPSPRFADTEVSIDELRQRIDATTDYLKTFQPQQFSGSAARTISYNAGGAARQSTGQDYLLNFALPNFYFHVATAHDILRHNGVPIGKRDYLGFGRE
jgi:uncharacterized protein